MINLKRIFKLWAYSISHKTLIIRSEFQFQDVEYENVYLPNSTIDLEFWDVNYIQSLTDFENISLSIEIDNFPANFEADLNDEKLKIYNLKSNNKDNYIIAGGCIIGKSSWTNEDRSQNFRLEYDEILYQL